MCDSLIHAELADTTSGGWPPECNWQVEPGPPGCRVPRLPDPGVRVKGDVGTEPGMSMLFLTINPPSDSRRAAEAGNDIRRTVTGREAWRSTVVRTCAHEGVGGHLQPISDISPSSCHGCSHLLGGGIPQVVVRLCHHECFEGCRCQSWLSGAACQCARGGRCQSAVETGERAHCGDVLRVLGAKGVEKTERRADATLGGMTNHGSVVGDQSANLCHK